MTSLKRTLRGRAVVALAAAGLVVPVVACDEDGNGTGPDEEGSVRAVVTDGPESAGASVTERQAARASAVEAASRFDVNGSFSGQARAEISADGETWVQLGDMQQLDVALQSGEEVTLHASAQVPARAYSRVRLVMEGAGATIQAGSTVGALLVGADVTVDVAGGGEFVIEKSATLNVSADSQTTVVFDLNSRAWLDESAVQAQSATAAAVESATTVTVQ